MKSPTSVTCRAKAAPYAHDVISFFQPVSLHLLTSLFFFFVHSSWITYEGKGVAEFKSISGASAIFAVLTARQLGIWS